MKHSGEGRSKLFHHSFCIVKTNEGIFSVVWKHMAAFGGKRMLFVDVTQFNASLV